MDGVTAAILVGGLGTRLRSAVSDRPKVLAEIGGRPFLAYLFDQLISARIPKAVLCTGYMADSVKDCFGDTYGPLEIVYSREETPLGTGGALRLALPHISSEAVLIMNGDSYIDVKLDSFADWFFSENRQAALLLTEVNDTSRYGRIGLDKNKKIDFFAEKCDKSGPGLINAGIYIINKSLIRTIPSGKPYSLERDLFPKLAGGELFGFCTAGKFIDIGTPESYSNAEQFFAGKKFD
jgi:D-glycero-alpha-D-manno-heptose 1-phosphate guanylyltransferase